MSSCPGLPAGMLIAPVRLGRSCSSQGCFPPSAARSPIRLLSWTADAADGVALNEWTDVVPDQPVPPGHWIAWIWRPPHRSTAELVHQVPHAVGEVLGVAVLELPLMIGDGQHRAALGMPAGGVARNALHEQVEVAFWRGVVDGQLDAE